MIQTFECVVTERTEDTVGADLADLTDPTQPRVWVEIYLTEFEEADRPLLKPGQVFYWIIDGDKEQSKIVVRKTPVWTEEELARFREDGRLLYERFCGSGGDQPVTDEYGGGDQ